MMVCLSLPGQSQPDQVSLSQTHKSFRISGYSITSSMWVQSSQRPLGTIQFPFQLVVSFRCYCSVRGDALALSETMVVLAVEKANTSIQQCHHHYHFVAGCYGTWSQVLASPSQQFPSSLLGALGLHGHVTDQAYVS